MKIIYQKWTKKELNKNKLFLIEFALETWIQIIFQFLFVINAYPIDILQPITFIAVKGNFTITQYNRTLTKYEGADFVLLNETLDEFNSTNWTDWLFFDNDSYMDTNILISDRTLGPTTSTTTNTAVHSSIAAQQVYKMHFIAPTNINISYPQLIPLFIDNYDSDRTVIGSINYFFTSQNQSTAILFILSLIISLMVIMSKVFLISYSPNRFVILFNGISVVLEILAIMMAVVNYLGIYMLLTYIGFAAIIFKK